LPLRGGSGIAVRLRAAEAGASPAATHGRYGAGRPGL